MLGDLPRQRLTLAEALTAYAAGTARVNHLDATGDLLSGSHAGFALLGRDPFAAPLEAVHQTRVRAAFIAGEEARTR